jgi:hypothetical protein
MTANASYSLTDHDVYYLGSIHRCVGGFDVAKTGDVVGSDYLAVLKSVYARLCPARDAVDEERQGASLVGEIFSDNADWLDCFIDMVDRRAMRPLYDIEFPASFRNVLIPFLDGIVEEVRRDHEADMERNHRPNEYIQWAEPLIARLRSAEGDYAPLDEMDMETLRRDVLPSLLSKTNDDISGLLEINFDRDILLEVLEEQKATMNILKRLERAVNHDLFDEDFRGDRPDAPGALDT